MAFFRNSNSFTRKRDAWKKKHRGKTAKEIKRALAEDRGLYQIDAAAHLIHEIMKKEGRL